MYKKTMTFEDYNGVERTQDFYFHISEAEMMNKETTHSKEQAWSDFLQKIIAEQDTGELIKEFEWFISFSYGEKSEDGLQFKKSPELSEAFKQHPAYGGIFMDIVTKDAANFVNQVFPSTMRKRMESIAEKTGKPLDQISIEDVQKVAEEEIAEQTQEEKPKSE